MPEAQSPVRTGLVETECRRVSWKGSYTTLEIEKQVVVVATVNAFLTVGSSLDAERTLIVSASEGMRR